jgi:hypothetical protein
MLQRDVRNPVVVVVVVVVEWREPKIRCNGSEPAALTGRGMYLEKLAGDGHL